MKKAYKLLKSLYLHDATNNKKGVQLPKKGTRRIEDKRLYDNMSFTSAEMDKIAKKLINKGYISTNDYTKSNRSKLVITDRGIKYTLDYLNKNQRGKFVYRCKEHTALGLIISFIALIASIIALVNSL